MSAVERLEAAINRLEQLRAEASPGPWRAWKVGPPLGLSYGIEDYRVNDVVFGGGAVDVELIELLHRTIDPQLRILRSALGQADGSPDEPGAVEDALVLADAILGSES